MFSDFSRWIWTWILVLVAGPIAFFALANVMMLLVLAYLVGETLQ